VDHLRVWVGDKPVGRLSRDGIGSTFVYDIDVDPKDAVSLNMPVRASSYDSPTEMLPAFDTNIPEGNLRLTINRVLEKDDSGSSDPFDVLALTGGNQIGKIRIIPMGEDPQRREPVGTIDALLASKSNSGMIKTLIEKHALRSGVSGAMPKILAETVDSNESRSTIQTRDWIMKFDHEDFPGLSMNEHHCLEAARLAGNITAEAHLSDEGTLLAVHRFDEKDGERLGFEDLASLNGKTAKDKYRGSIESDVFKRVAEFSGPAARENLERLYRQVITSFALRNGDAHLKNFGLLYENATDGPFKLAPLYDVVTTRAFDQYKEDTMGLTLGGTKRWPKAAQVKKMGARARLSPKQSEEIMEDVSLAVKEQMKIMLLDITARGLPELAMKMAEEWNEGITLSLGAEPVDIQSIMPSQEDLDEHRKALTEISVSRIKIDDPFTAVSPDPDDTPEPT
jgi:serine/threonine-protein kinase HipA